MQNRSLSVYINYFDSTVISFRNHMTVDIVKALLSLIGLLSAAPRRTHVPCWNGASCKYNAISRCWYLHGPPPSAPTSHAPAFSQDSGPSCPPEAWGGHSPATPAPVALGSFRAVRDFSAVSPVDHPGPPSSSSRSRLHRRTTNMLTISERKPSIRRRRPLGPSPAPYSLRRPPS